MNLIEATKLLKEGNKIRRKTWNSNAYLKLEPNNPMIVNNYREYFRPAIETLLANDWEIYVESKTTMPEKILRKDNFCWHCGAKNNLTAHHLQMRRKRNAQGDLERGTIPLCRDCHVDVERLRNNAEKVYKKKHKETLIRFIEKSHLITTKQKTKLIPQLNRLWKTKDVVDEKGVENVNKELKRKAGDNYNSVNLVEQVDAPDTKYNQPRIIT